MRKIIFFIVVYIIPNIANALTASACMEQCVSSTTAKYCCPTTTPTCPSGWGTDETGYCVRELNIISQTESTYYVEEFGTCLPTANNWTIQSSQINSNCIPCKAG